MKIKIGSRESALAVAQTRCVMDALHAAHPDIELDLVTMKTTGDKILDRTLDKVGGKGLFVKELDRALLDGTVDLTVHSFKDLPMEADEQLPIVAVSQREDPRDALILPQGAETFDPSRPIGCASARRRIQLERLFPGVEIKPVRGNVLTRLDKLDRGEYGALVLACAGLRRLSLEGRISRIFTPEEIIPAACQGVLAVQARKGFDTSLLACFHNKEAEATSLAERAFVRTLDGGCSSPVAAYARIKEGKLVLTGLYANEDGSGMCTGSAEGAPADAQALGRALALRLKEGKGTL